MRIKSKEKENKKNKDLNKKIDFFKEEKRNKKQNKKDNNKQKEKPKKKKINQKVEVKVIEELKEPEHTMSFDFDYKEPKEEKKKPDKIVINRYNPNPDIGLTEDEADDRKIVGLSNKQKRGSSKSYTAIVLKNTFTFFNVLMILIAVALIWVQTPINDFMFLVAVFANTIIGIIQEIRAKKIIDKLSIMQTPTTKVIRSGLESEVSIDDIVLDDIIILTPGKQVPADAILIGDGVIEVNESLLTGESDAIVKKDSDALYAGSYVVSGRAKAQVTKVGKNTYIAKLTNQAKQYKKPKSQLLKSLNILITTLAVIIVPLGTLLLYVSSNKFSFTGPELNKAIQTTAASMVGMVPSGLFLLSSIALAVGVLKLANNNTLVQELYCIEMLARVDTLCLDKTGTLTDGSMKVRELYLFSRGKDHPIKDILSTILKSLDDDNATSQALKEMFYSEKTFKVLNTIPFSSERKYSAVEFSAKGTYVLGAPEMILGERINEISDEVEKRTLKGQRVLLLAHSKGSIKSDNTISYQLYPLAIIALEDTLRVDARETLQYFNQSGVEIKIISGDNAVTASRIAQRAGVMNAHKYISLENSKNEDIYALANEYTIFGRVSPQQKKLLVKAMQAKGKTVAMTGDGVNDILALREADASIAMASGSDAAKNASHLVLLDSNFSSMPKVVAEGRRVINNVQRVATIFLTKTLFSMLLTIITIIRGFRIDNATYPLIPRQLIPIEWFVIGIPSFFLVLEYNNKKIDAGHFLWNMIKKALPGALTIIVMSFFIYTFSERLGVRSQTIATLISITATTVSFMVLYKVCYPFSLNRKIMFWSMVTLFVLSIVFIPGFYDFVPFWEVAWYRSNIGTSYIGPLNPVENLFLITLVLGGYPIMYIVNNTIPWIKNIWKKIIDFAAMKR